MNEVDLIKPMKPKKSSYTFITLPAPVVVPEAAVDSRCIDGKTSAAPVRATPHSRGAALGVNTVAVEQTTSAGAFVTSAATATDAASSSFSPASDEATSSVATDAVTSSLFINNDDGIVAANRLTLRKLGKGRPAYDVGSYRSRIISCASAVSPETTTSTVKTPNATHGGSHSPSGSVQHKKQRGNSTEEHGKKNGGAEAASPTCTNDSISSRGAVRRYSTSDSVGWKPTHNESYLHSRKYPPLPSPFSPPRHSDSSYSSASSSVSSDTNRFTLYPRGHSYASLRASYLSDGLGDSSSRPADYEEASAFRRRYAAAGRDKDEGEEHNGSIGVSQRQRTATTDRQDSSNSSSPSRKGVTVPSFEDASLPPLAVEDAAMMLREFAALVQRLEYSGQQVLQQNNDQPQKTIRTRNQVRQSLSPHEQLQQQAIVCSSVSARLQRLFETSATSYTAAQSTSPATPGTAAGVSGDSSPQKKQRHQLLLPGIRSRADIQLDTGTREEGWQDRGASTNRIALRTLGTFSTTGSNSSFSFEQPQAAYSPSRNSLEQHRGRLRLAKLKEDFERLQQKHERLVTLFNIRMLLPLGRRSSSGGNSPHIEKHSSAAAEAGSSVRSHRQTAEVVASGQCNNEGATTVGEATALNAEASATVAVENTGILTGLDFSHFAESSGSVEDTGVMTHSSPFTRGRLRSSSSSMTLDPGGASSRLRRLPSSTGVKGACTPLHNLLRCTSTASSGSGNSSTSGGESVGLRRGLRSSTGSGFLGKFYSFNDPNSFSFGDSLLPPIYLGPIREEEPDDVGVADGSVSRGALSSAQHEDACQQQLSERKKLFGNNADSPLANCSGGSRWRRGLSSVLFPGEPSLEDNIWRPTRLQEIDEGFEEQQRREQLQQLQHIEECVQVLHELHVQIADEVEAADEPLAAVAAETDAAGVQIAQANRELVTASLRRSKWWTVQGGGVAAAAGVVVGGLTGGPIGAALGLMFGAFVGATSGSALEREHRRKLSRFVGRGKTRERKKASRRGEQHTTQLSCSLTDAGVAESQQHTYHGEQELVTRVSRSDTSERATETEGKGDRGISSPRAAAEKQRAQLKTGVLCAKPQYRGTATEQTPVSSRKTRILQEAESEAAHEGHVGLRRPQQQRQDDHSGPLQQRERCGQRVTAHQNGNDPVKTSSNKVAATHSKVALTISCSSLGAIDSAWGSGDGAVSCSSQGTTVASSSRAGLRSNHGGSKDVGDAVDVTNRRRGGHQTRPSASRIRGDRRSANVPLPALLGLGWGRDSRRHPDRKTG